MGNSNVVGYIEQNAMTASDQPMVVTDQPKKIWVIAIFLLYNLLPYSWAIFTLIVAPGFVIPFLNHPTARVVLLTLTSLQLVLVILFIRRELLRKDPTTNLRYWPYWFFASMLGILVFMTPMLGPVLITIVEALRPMFHL